MSNIIVTGCTISGWAVGLLFHGGWNCSICNNVFLFPMGHDSGTVDTNGWENVGINLGQVTNTAFWNHNFFIYNNYFNGLSATNTTNGLVVPQTGDGLLNATADGVSCYSNLVVNNSVEGIGIWNPPNAAVYSACYISNNIGSNSASLAGVWGIVCDASWSQVHDNHLTNDYMGFLAAGTASNPLTNISFYNNNVMVASGTTGSAGYGFAVGSDIEYSYGAMFSNNNFTLNLANAPTGGANTNLGIQVVGGSNNYFWNNTYTATNHGTSGYEGVAVDGFLLNSNYGNFSNNYFTNTFMRVLAASTGPGPYYPVGGSGYPNNTNTTIIENFITNLNSFFP